MLLAARAAAMRQFQEEGWLDLPRRRMPARVQGLSGETHEAWVEFPAERVRITDVDFRDRVVAVLTLDDGRQLRVKLTGTLEVDATDESQAERHLVPTILLSVDDPALAGMAPDEIRRRLTLLPEVLCWRTHWNDPELTAQAEVLARELALSNFDEVPDGLELAEDLDPALKRQTVLHYAVMQLLAESKRLQVPGWAVCAEATGPDGRLVRREALSAPQLLNVDFVELEARFGNIVPDVTCKAWPVNGGEVLWPLFIEVTVTNQMTSERLNRIRAAGMPTLEVDLSLTGGRIDREGLRSLVIDGLDIKRWLFHPEMARRQRDLENALAQEVEAAREAAARRSKLREMSVSDLARCYLAAAVRLADAEVAEESGGGRQPGAEVEVGVARAELADVVRAMSVRGYPEAGDVNLIGSHGIVPRILSIKLGRPVGYRLENVAGVLNAIELSKGVRRAEASIYLIAVRVYAPLLTDKQQIWFDEWARRVRESLKRGEKTYLRDPSYDRLLSVLFPEMSAALAKPAGKHRPEDVPAHGDWKAAKSMGVPPRQSAAFLAAQLHKNDQRRELQDTKPGEHWLKGRELDDWKRANPESAKRWFGDDMDV
jgi:hypothetical protein